MNTSYTVQVYLAPTVTAIEPATVHVDKEVSFCRSDEAADAWR